jgi:predicted N-formylglutamate amidohydrolase
MPAPADTARNVTALARPLAARSVVTCEHAGCRVPAELFDLASGRERMLAGPRGFDAGALVLARALARRLGEPLHASFVTRLLVDANRSPHNPRVFGALAARLDAAGRRRALERWYRPYRERVETAILAFARRRRVVHVSVHTFSPRTFSPPPWDAERSPDFGILYDPSRPGERAFAARLRAAVLRDCPELRVRRNFPFRGRSDGLATAMRRRLGGRRYLGIEIELSQEIAARPVAEWRDLRSRLVGAIASAIEARGGSASASRVAAGRVIGRGARSRLRGGRTLRGRRGRRGDSGR